MKVFDSGQRSFLAVRPDVVLQLEGLVALLVCCFAYNHVYSGHWAVFALLFLAPDISLLAYLMPDRRWSAACYNVFHSSAVPLVLGLVAWEQGWLLSGQLALIWFAHISFDRMLGFGLKYPREFQHTHIQSSADGGSG